MSNFGVDRWTAAEQALGRPVLSNQVRFNLLQRKHDEGNVPYAQANERIVIAYSPLAQGVLGGRYDAAHPPSGPARLNNPLCLPENLERAGRAHRARSGGSRPATTRRRPRSRWPG